MVAAKKPRARRDTADAELAAQLELANARLAATLTALKAVLEHCVDRKAHAFAKPQEAMWAADALIADSERW